jgi:hypothetical protein
MLSLLIFGYFHGYMSELGNELINTLNKRCEFEVMSVVANTSGSTITSLSIVLYNYGGAACPISGVFLINGSAIYPIRVSSNCVVSPIAVLNPGQVEILNYTGLNIPYHNVHSNERLHQVHDGAKAGNSKARKHQGKS